MVVYCATATCYDGYRPFGTGPTCVAAEIEANSQCVGHGGVKISADCWVCG
jgi:hypothetical protein